ncbi:aromatic peroxygenase like protein [Zymoseptoria brevis]|uniref:Aromatic peroxygenase like protein n=1 Tax=Zymoseptoria brevis TaxID=1047168 RepID=A0A0F4GTH2_9PEZI|nr:aromatic peroxygenase like protein [Zymoseptoria brevis]
MKTTFSGLALPTLALALPQMLTGANSGQKLGLPTVSGLLDDVSGLLGSVASSINPDNKRPESGYEFMEPGPNDSRGPCPGLNLLANYGYLPRNGHVTSSQVIEAVSRGFNMGADLATVLAVFAVLPDGDIETQSWWLGAGPNNFGGLNRHSTVEVDISPNKEDFYNGSGDNHHISSRIFKQNVEFVKQDPNKEFSYDVMRRQYSANAAFSKQYNPYLYYFPFPSIVSVVAFNFYPEYFSNGTYGAGGVANYESISSIVGAKYDKKTGDYEYVPERWPENWYRRATPYGAGLNSITPLAIAGQSRAAQASLTWALGKLIAVGLDGTTLGCPKTTISQNFYPDVKGGPLQPPPVQSKNNGNNVYNKVYHRTAPKQPICDITAPAAPAY